VCEYMNVAYVNCSAHIIVNYEVAQCLVYALHAGVAVNIPTGLRRATLRQDPRQLVPHHHARDMVEHVEREP
jgi:hypothetical protein